MRLGFGSGGAEGEVKICRLPTCFPGGNGLWVNRGCLLELATGIKQNRGIEVRRGVSVGVCWRWASKEGCSRCSVTELRMRLGNRFGGEEKVVKVFSWLACFFVLLSWCVHRECLLVLEAEIRGGVGAKKVGGDLCDLLGMESEGKGSLQQVLPQSWV